MQKIKFRGPLEIIIPNIINIDFTYEWISAIIVK